MSSTPIVVDTMPAQHDHPSPPPRVRACLFDMDGLLINTEDIFTKCANLILRKYNRPDFPWSIKARLQGRVNAPAMAVFLQWAQLPVTAEEYEIQNQELETRYLPTCAPLPGVVDLIRTLRDLRDRPSPTSSSSDGKEKGRKGRGIEFALATSSSSYNYNLKTQNNFDTLFGMFEEKCIIKGDDEGLKSGRGKPCPDIFLLALRRINDGIRERNASRRNTRGEQTSEDEAMEEEISPEECLVFEDAVLGVEAARRAGMQVVWIPHEGLLAECKGHEKLVLAGQSTLFGVDMDASKDDSSVLDVQIHKSEVDDGWAKMLTTLEGFDYASYGIDV